MKIGVIGANGLLGRAVVAAITATPGCSAIAWTRADVDVADAAAVATTIGAQRLDAVVNTAAFHKVDDCEGDPARAFAVNALGALHVARTCAADGAVPIFVSTNYVFDGARSEPYTEEDATCPLMVYGASKVAGEQLTRAASPRSLVCRVACLYGPGGAVGEAGHFIERMLAGGEAGAASSAFDDTWTSPTYTVDAAETILALLRAQATGVYHVTNAGQCTWWELATAALRCAGYGTPIDRARQPRRTVPRPPRAALRSVRLPLAGVPSPRPWQDGLRAYVAARRGEAR